MPIHLPTKYIPCTCINYLLYSTAYTQQHERKLYMITLYYYIGEYVVSRIIEEPKTLNTGDKVIIHTSIELLITATETQQLLIFLAMILV